MPRIPERPEVPTTGKGPMRDDNATVPELVFLTANEMVVDALECRWEVPPALKARVLAIGEAEALPELLRKAVTAATLEEFEEALAELS